MAKYKFLCEHDDGSTVEVSTSQVTLPEILEQFEFFLLGCGFVISLGSLQVEKPEQDSTE